MLEGTTCAVAGASGFLGRRLAQLLDQDGVEVKAIVRPSSQVNLPSNIPIVRCQVSDLDTLASALDRTAILFNCIGHSADWGPWKHFREGNIESVKYLCRAAARAGVVRLLHVSTTDVYGYPRNACDESHRLTDVGLPYNRSKILGDRLARALGNELGLDVIVVRPATIFGPGCHDWVLDLSRMLQAKHVPMIGGGRTNAGLVFVDDVAHAMITLAGVSPGNESYNIADPTSITWLAYFASLCNIIGAPLPSVNIPEKVAFSLAGISEAIWRTMRYETRPLFTRHVVYVMCRDQHYPTEKLRARVADFPRVGLHRGLHITRSWLAEELKCRGGEL